MTLRRVLIVEDHKVVAEGLMRLLRDHYQVAGTIGDGSLVVDAAARLRPDLILMDLSLPHVSGLEATRLLKAQGNPVKVIILTMHAEPHLAVEALRAGASGFLLKEASGEELLQAIQVVLDGSTYLTAGLTKEVVTLMLGATDPGRVDLTVQQREVLRLIVHGRRAKEIASTLDMTTRSVEATKHRMMQILNVHSTAELVRYAVEHRLVPF
jgi:DNA-binding NarL/FixJ family response regulator